MSTTSHAILGLLSLRSWTTYELAKQVQRSLGWFWPRAERKLYDEPKRLVAAGLATSDRGDDRRRDRAPCTRSPARGRKALRRWLDEPPAPPTLEFEGMVKVFFADGGNARTAARHARRASPRRPTRASPSSRTRSTRTSTGRRPVPRSAADQHRSRCGSNSTTNG